MEAVPPLPDATPVVVLVSGSGTNLQALIDACEDPAYGVRIVAVGSDRTGIAGLERAERAAIPTFVLALSDFDSREAWDAALDRVRAEPGLVLDAWTAYALEPTSVEFWASSGAGQTRLRYTAASGAPTTWTKELLWP